MAVFIYPSLWNKTADFVNARFKTERVPYLDFLPFKLGLDLVGGTSLIYQADISNVLPDEVADSMAGARDVIERRVNLFGVREPSVRISGENRIIVELAGVKEISEAIKLIGETPFLEFRLEKPATESLDFESVGLTGKQLKRSQLAFDQQTGVPQIGLEFDSEGAKILKETTRNNIGKRLAIYLDGVIISAPVIQNEITDGQALITGQFTLEEARILARRLNAGALPLPITLISQKTIGASLGKESLDKSLKAGLIGLVLVALFLIIYYRLSGLMAVLALFFYTVAVLSLYKLLGVTLTLAGIAGFILSLGMAVDANILIFSRMREEIKQGKSVRTSIIEGFSRAWFSIRDSQVTTLLAALILFIYSTSLVKGFALTLSIGILVSIFSAMVITKSYLWAISRWMESRRNLV